MSFQIGDKVAVLDDDISGVIVEISSDSIGVETADGFVLEFKSNELVKSKSFASDVFSNDGLQEVIKEKESYSKKFSVKKNKSMM